MVLGKLIAYGPSSGDTYKMIKDIPDIRVKANPKDDLPCDEDDCDEDAASHEGNTQELIMTKTDIADIRALGKMFVASLDTQRDFTHILVIAPDSDFLPTMYDFHDSQTTLVMCAKVDDKNPNYGRKPTWLWSDMMCGRRHIPN